MLVPLAGLGLIVQILLTIAILAMPFLVWATWRHAQAIRRELHELRTALEASGLGGRNRQ